MGENVELLAGVPPWVKATRRVAEAPPLRLVRPPEEPATPKVASAPPDVAARPVTPEVVGVLREIACAVRELRGCLLAPSPAEGSVGNMGEPAPTPALVGVTLDEAIQRWSDSMLARVVKPSSTVRMTAMVRRAADFAGWQTADQVTYAEAVAFLASKRRPDGEGRDWSGPTYDQAVSTLRVFGDFLRRNYRLPENPLKDLEPSGEPGGDGARALSVEDARGMIASAIARHLDSRRARGLSPVVWLFMFKTGLRCNETASVEWSNLLLDDDTPLLVTNPRWDKSGRKNTIPLNREVAEQLRRLRASLDKPTGLVFPVMPNRDTWNKDRESAGIPEIDRRGRGATMHSARKSFATWLDRAGVPAGFRSQLMRHAETLAEARYTDHALPELSTAIDRLEPLWPKDLDFFAVGWKKTVARAGVGRYSLSSHTKAPTVNQPRSDGGSCCSPSCDNLAALEPPSARGFSADAAPGEAPKAIQVGNGHFRPESEALNRAVEALAAFVMGRLGSKGADREPADHHPDPRPQNPPAA